MTDRAHMPSLQVPNLLCYEELLEAENDRFEWPVFDERAACALCYTSGTTGNPKGVLYSHRSMLLHCYASRSEEHTSELQSLMRISYAVFCLKKKKNTQYYTTDIHRLRTKL